MKLLKGKIFNLILFFIIIYIISIIFSCRTIAIKTYTIESPLFMKDSGLKIILISDLHNSIYGKDQTPLIDKIKQQNPDLIVLTGDIFDNKVRMTGTKLLLSGISNSAPVYYVTGNHEYRSKKMKEIREHLEYYGILVLSDEYTKIKINKNEFILARIEDPEKKKYEEKNYDQNTVMEERFRELDNMVLYKILLTHRPERIKDYQKFSFNLILSGHTHGGQIRIPKIVNGLFAPNQGFFPKYGGGMYQHDNLVHIISRGLALNIMRPRIFNSPELVVINIKSNK